MISVQRHIPFRTVLILKITVFYKNFITSFILGSVINMHAH